MFVHLPTYTFVVSAKGLIQCKRTDPKLNECLKNEIQNAISFMIKGKNIIILRTYNFFFLSIVVAWIFYFLVEAKIYFINKYVLFIFVPVYYEGIPELGINKIDPFRIVKLDVNENTGPLVINSTFTDIDIHNMKYIVFNKVQ